MSRAQGEEEVTDIGGSWRPTTVVAKFSVLCVCGSG